MKIIVTRKWFDENSTISELEVNGFLECYVLEDTVREVEGEPVESWKIPGETAIPYGTYAVEITYSNRFKKDMMQIMDVPGFEGIRVHSGNGPSDTEGCLLVGNTKDKDAVGGSRLALIRLFSKVQAALGNGDNVTIEIKKESE